jgi:hemerythrin-like domain-containing protein
VGAEPDKVGVTEVAPVEDLMREHGLLNRVLLIYDEIIRRMDNDFPFSADHLKKSATIIKTFIEEYHEKLEEEYLFTRLEKAQLEVDLVKTLREQHLQGRRLTSYLITHANETDLRDRSIRKEVKNFLHEFIDMYRPHEAREDTVLFPAFKTIVTQQEYNRLGDLFEEREQQLFGKNGFEKIVEEVAAIEKALGIYELSKFTPKL